MKQHMTLIVKKHPDGYHYVPFDGGSEHPHRAHYLAHLTDTGHTFAPLEDGGVKLLSGPHSHVGA